MRVRAEFSEPCNLSGSGMAEIYDLAHSHYDFARVDRAKVDVKKLI